MQDLPEHVRHSLTVALFRRRFRWLILLTWIVPAVFGMGFILFIRVFTWEQLLLVQTRPLEPLFVLVTVLATYRYFIHYVQPVEQWMRDPTAIDGEQVLRCIRGFPLRYWVAFLGYLILAPTVVINAAVLYSDFVATPVVWFRVHLVALIVSIIVGLPIFFMIFNLFGRALGSLVPKRPVLAIKTKVFLIGALVPLLIDTMLVQYYWTRTGFFTFETFGMWLLLEALAVGGSLIFVHSFGQSLAPLQKLIATPHATRDSDLSALRPDSTDELGLLTAGYHKLLTELHLHNEILLMKNELLRRTGIDFSVNAVFSAIVDLCMRAIDSDQAFLVLHDPASNELVGVAQTGDGYRPEGHFRLRLDEVSLAVWAFNHGITAVSEDTLADARVSREMCERYGVGASLATPLCLEGRVRGVLLVSDQRRRHYSYREREMVDALAREAALVLQAQRLREERAQAERERLAQVELVQLLMDATEEGIFGVDSRGLCTFINPAALRMLGYADAEALLGKHIHDMIHHTHADGRPYPREQCQVQNAMRLGETVHNDNDCHWRADGTSFPIEYWSRPIRRDGEIAGAVVSFIDISVRKASERELAQYRLQLEERVRARTLELETLNQELETFSYSVSHDLRAPLRAVDGFAQALAEDYRDLLDATGRDYLNRIRGGAQRMGDLIDDLLQLSRVGRIDLHQDQVPLSELAEGVLQQLAAADPRRQVAVTIEPGLTTTGDVQLLLIALTNLLENAWKYTSHTEHAAIEFGKLSGEGDTVYFVRDNGAGFDMRYADKLFGPFQRLHGSEFPGTGIGLATVSRIIHRHGGRVWADATPDRGATFFFTLHSSHAVAALKTPASGPARLSDI